MKIGINLVGISYNDGSNGSRYRNYEESVSSFFRYIVNPLLEKGHDIKFYLLVGGGGFLLFKGYKFLKGILENLGLSQSQSDINVNTAQTNPNSPWSPLYYKTAQRQGHSVMLYTVASTDLLCKQIYESVGWFTDNWSQAFGAIKQCKYKTQISFLCERFKIKYNADLITWLPGSYYPNDRFSNDEVNQAIQYVSNLPKGY